MNVISHKINKYFILHKRKLIFFIKLIIACLLILYIYKSVSIKNIITALNNVNLFPLFCAILLIIPNLILQFNKWKLICNYSLFEFDNRKIFISLFSGFTAAVITPARLGELAGRMNGLDDKDPIKIASATILDKLFTLLQTLIIGITSLIIYVYYTLHISLLVIIQTILIFSVSGLLLYYFLGYLNKKYVLIKRIKLPSKIKSALEIFMLYKKNIISKLFLLSFCFYTCYLLQYALFIFAFSNQSIMLKFLWIGSLVMFIKALLPISVGELGIRESASVFLFPQIGVEASSALNASIFLFLINILLPSLIGLFILFRNK